MSLLELFAAPRCANVACSSIALTIAGVFKAKAGPILQPLIGSLTSMTKKDCPLLSIADHIVRQLGNLKWDASGKPIVPNS